MISIADKLIQTQQRLWRRSNVHERKEKMNRRRLLLHLPGLAQPLALQQEVTRTVNPYRLLTSIRLSNYEPTVPCVFSSRWQLSLAAVEFVALARALAPCHIQFAREKASVYTASAHGQPRYNNDTIAFSYQLVKSSMFNPIITY